MKVKKKIRLEPYWKTSDGWTKVYNTMFRYIESPTAYKVYSYLCYRYNMAYHYSFPSLTTIADECKLSRSTVQKAIKYLEDNKFIVKYKQKESDWMNNCYYINYVVEENIEEIQMEIAQKINKRIGVEKEIEMEIKEYERQLNENKVFGEYFKS